MRASTLLLAIFLLVPLTGCQAVRNWVKKPVASPQQGSQVGQAQQGTDQATQKADNAQTQVDAKVKQIGSEVRANIQNAREENKLQPPGPHTESVEGELSLADKKLVTVPVDPTELALGQARREANLQGKSETYQKLYEQSSKKSEDLVKDLASAQTAKEEAVKERDAAREREKTVVKEYQATVEKNAEEFKKKWDEEMARRDKNEKELKDGIARQTQLWLTMGCYGLGVACFIFVAVRAFMAFQTGGVGLTGLFKSSGIVMVAGACFFALGKFTSQPWFWWVCGLILAGVVVSAVVAMIFDAHHAKKQVEEKKEIQACTDDVIAGVEELRTTSKNPPASMVQAMQAEMGPNTTPEQAIVAIKAALKTVVDPTLKQWVTEGDGVAEYVDQRRRALELVAPPKAA
jgi:uncharacterized membrane-anchored protein YhcB (DUF1043 family)